MRPAVPPAPPARHGIILFPASISTQSNLPEIAAQVLIPVAGTEHPDSSGFVQELTRRLTSSGDLGPARVRSENVR